MINNHTSLWVSFGLVIVCAVAIVYVWHARTHRNPDAGLTPYSDPIYPFAISYPSDFSLTASMTSAQKQHLMTYMGSCPVYEDDPRAKNGIGICYTGPLTADGFDMASVTIDLEPATSTESCENGLPSIDGSPAQRVTVNGIDFLMNSYGEAGLGHENRFDSYRAYHEGICYTVTLSIESDRGSSEQGLSPGFRALMEDKVKAIFDTFKFTR